MNTKIGTLNLCLGLKNKKEEVKQLIIKNKIDILCIQETELEKDYPVEILTFKGYGLEMEKNTTKLRSGIYIKDSISYTRRTDLEEENTHVVIIDINDRKKTRIINIYRAFNPPPGLTQKALFDKQIQILNNAANPNVIIMGDFNLDYNKKHDVSYSHRNYFIALDTLTESFNLTQIVNFDTWSRIVLNRKQSSCIDHIYIRNPTSLSDIKSTTPPFGDHQMVSFIIKSVLSPANKIFRRNWKNYSKEALNIKLSETNWQIEHDDVQGYWNCFESKLVNITDELAPVELIPTKQNTRDIAITTSIKNKINRRDRLLKKTISNNTPEKKYLLKSLNKEIKLYFLSTKSKLVRRNLVPGNSKSLWDAVKIANDVNVSGLPDTMYENGNKLSPDGVASAFGDLFVKKVKLIVESTRINPQVHNGTQKIFNIESQPLSETDLLECINSLKIKNCEGYDRIPQRILSEGAMYLIKPLKGLFKLIFEKNKIPEQWLISKTIPIHKKGPKQNIENYRPISNLCSTSKIFEKIILKRIQKLELLNNVDITGQNQHGFKKNKSTSTLGILLQSLVARALDEDKHCIMASVDLSSAFDVVNIKLLLKRLRIVGLPADLVALIEIWLSNRMFYVEVNGLTSNFQQSDSGTIQGSILGPILYAIFVAPLFDLTDLYNFADDNFTLSSSQDKNIATQLITQKLTLITYWLKDSGLSVNESKTEICLFYHKSQPPIEILLNDVLIKSKNTMNVLGVLFDSCLSWTNQISQTITKAKRALHAIKLIKKYFNQQELLTLLTSNFYSILYYNSEIWHLPTLAPQLKQLLLSASATALKITQRTPNPMQSFIDIHTECKRALPEQMMIYKHSLLLHKLYNTQLPESEWIALNFQQIITSRQTNFSIIKNNNRKIGNNIITNRLYILNNRVLLSDLNDSISTFKVKQKKNLL